MFRKKMNLTLGQRSGLVPCAGAILAVLTMVACGGGDDDAATASGDGGDLGTIRVVTVNPHSLQGIALFKGSDFGAWDDLGLTVEVITATSATADTTLATGDADIAMQSSNKPAADIAKGLESKIVAAFNPNWGQVIIARDDYPAEAPEDLKGATFGVSGFGSGGHYATLQTAEELGWSESDYEITQLGGIEQLTAALTSGAIDAFIWNDTEGANLEGKGVGRVLGPVDPYVRAPGGIFNATDQVLEERPEAVKAFFEGYFAMVEELQADPERVRGVLVDEWDQDPTTVDLVYERVLADLSTDGVIPPDQLDGIADAATALDPEVDEVNMDEIYLYWGDL